MFSSGSDGVSAIKKVFFRITCILEFYNLVGSKFSSYTAPTYFLCLKKTIFFFINNAMASLMWKSWCRRFACNSTSYFDNLFIFSSYLGLGVLLHWKPSLLWMEAFLSARALPWRRPPQLTWPPWRCGWVDDQLGPVPPFDPPFPLMVSTVDEFFFHPPNWV